MRTTNLTRRSPLPDDTFLLYWTNWEFIKGVSNRIRGSHEKLLLYGVLCILALLAMLGLSAYSWSEHQRWREQGVQVPGVVVTVEPEKEERLYITFEYTPTAQGQPELFRNDERVDKVFGRPQPGDAVSVRYLPDRPAESTITWRDEWEFIPILCVLAVVLVLAGPALTLDTWRRLRLLRGEGWLVAGVASAVQVNPSNGKQLLVLDYTFTTPDGRQLRDRTTYEFGGVWGVQIQVPAPGQGVAVLYVSDKLYQLL